MNEEDDIRELVERARTLDSDAWEALYRRSYRPLFGYARRRLSNPEAADDAVSETMTRALGRIESFTWQGAGFDAWLFGILRNVVLESYRDDRRRAYGVEVPEEVSTETPLDHLLRAERVASVREAFEALEPDDREVLELRLLAGMSSEAVGSVQGRTAGAVRMAQVRALSRLRSLLGEDARDV